MIVAVGDVHAYGTKLADLMLKLESRVNFETTTFVFLGDYVDGGPDAKHVVEALMYYQKTYPHWQFLYGNHEDLMLSGIGYCRSRCEPYIVPDFYLWYRQGGMETAMSYFPDRYIPYMDESDYQLDLPKEHLEWLRTRPIEYETDHYVFVHAGLAHGKTLAETSDFTKLWVRDSFIQSTHDWGKKVVFGHTYHPAPIVHQNKIGIDTMHHGGGCLTAVILNEDEPFVHEFVHSFTT